MPAIIIRLGILLLACLVTLLVVRFGRRYVEKQREQALAALPPLASFQEDFAAQEKQSSTAQILAFSSEDCHQCHQLQTPALNRVQEALGNSVSVEEIDAPTSPELTRRYHILTVPSTVVLDANGRAHAVNYGFANAQQLIAQVQEAVMPKQTA